MDAINAGARDYILKPFTPEDLLKAVDKVLLDYEEPSMTQKTAQKGANHGI